MLYCKTCTWRFYAVFTIKMQYVWWSFPCFQVPRPTRHVALGRTAWRTLETVVQLANQHQPAWYVLHVVGSTRGAAQVRTASTSIPFILEQLIIVFSVVGLVCFLLYGCCQVGCTVHRTVLCTFHCLKCWGCNRVIQSYLYNLPEIYQRL